jgi:hypothetical protein
MILQGPGRTTIENIWSHYDPSSRGLSCSSRLVCCWVRRRLSVLGVSCFKACHCGLLLNIHQDSFQFTYHSLSEEISPQLQTVPTRFEIQWISCDPCCPPGGAARSNHICACGSSPFSPFRSLTLIGLGEVKVDLAIFDLKLQENLLSNLILF